MRVKAFNWTVRTCRYRFDWVRTNGAFLLPLAIDCFYVESWRIFASGSSKAVMFCNNNIVVVRRRARRGGGRLRASPSRFAPVSRCCTISIVENSEHTCSLVRTVVHMLPVALYLIAEARLTFFYILGITT